MKKLILLLAAGILSVAAFGQSSSTESASNSGKSMNWKYKYCASLKSGKVIMKNEDKDLLADVTLDNGIVVTKDGYVVDKSGKKTAIKNGECVDNQGVIVTPKKENMKKDSK